MISQNTDETDEDRKIKDKIQREEQREMNFKNSNECKNLKKIFLI